jgi:hypothetical protein
MDERMTKTLGDALGLAAGIARHVAWYVSHQMYGSPRARP